MTVQSCSVTMHNTTQSSANKIVIHVTISRRHTNRK